MLEPTWNLGTDVIASESLVNFFCPYFKIEKITGHLAPAVPSVLE
jgi:hypothetical protein